jgi:hypothetical protein
MTAFESSKTFRWCHSALDVTCPAAAAQVGVREVRNPVQSCWFQCRKTPKRRTLCAPSRLSLGLKDVTLLGVCIANDEEVDGRRDRSRHGGESCQVAGRTSPGRYFSDRLNHALHEVSPRAAPGLGGSSQLQAVGAHVWLGTLRSLRGTPTPPPALCNFLKPIQ